MPFRSILEYYSWRAKRQMAARSKPPTRAVTKRSWLDRAARNRMRKRLQMRVLPLTVRDKLLNLLRRWEKNPPVVLNSCPVRTATKQVVLDRVVLNSQPVPVASLLAVTEALRQFRQTGRISCDTPNQSNVSKPGLTPQLQAAMDQLAKARQPTVPAPPPYQMEERQWMRDAHQFLSQDNPPEENK